MAWVQMENQSQQSAWMILSILTLFFCGLLYGCLIDPLRHGLNKHQNEISSLILVLSKKGEKETRLAKSSTLISEQEKQLNTLITSLRKRPPSILPALQELASEHRLGLYWRIPGPSTDQKNDGEEDLSFHVLSLELGGKYHDIRNFFDSVAQLEWLLGTESFEIETTKNAAHSSTLQAKLSLRILSRDRERDITATLSQ